MRTMPKMAPAKTKAYSMLLNRILVDDQPILIARQATLKLKNADGPKKAKVGTPQQALGQLMEVHIDDKVLVSLSVSMLLDR